MVLWTKKKVFWTVSSAGSPWCYQPEKPTKRKEVRKGADQANYIYKSQLKAFVQQHQSEASLQETA